MCGRFASSLSGDQLAAIFDVDEQRAGDLAASWNVAPTNDVYAVSEHDERRVLVTFRWGLVPFWADDPKIGSKMINARAETVAEKPAYRESLARRRCLIPADGFYEWQRRGPQRKQPYFAHRTDGQAMAFAGLWASWRPKDEPDAERLRTCTIITTNANETVADIHNRMPVILERDAWDLWLDESIDDTATLTEVLHSAAAGVVTTYPVDTAVGNVRNNSPALVEPIT